MLRSIGNESENLHMGHHLPEEAGDVNYDSWGHDEDEAAGGVSVSVSREPTSGDDKSPPPDDVFADEEEKIEDNEIERGPIREPPGFLDTDCGSMSVRALIGLGIAGLGGTLVADVFGMFYVDCFLRAYELPMRVFGVGSAIFAVINTANDVAGAYLLDWYAAPSNDNNNNNTKKREDLVGLSGCLFALSFLGPFFRWGPRSGQSVRNGRSNGETAAGVFWDGLHFVGSLSIYDTMFSFNCILQGSIVSDNHSMTENQRIGFFALRDLVGILAPLVVTKVGLSLFDVSDLSAFRIFLVVLVVLSSLLSVWGQALIHHTQNSVRLLPSRKLLPAFLQAQNLSSGYSRVSHEVSNSNSNCEGRFEATATIDVGGKWEEPSANTSTTIESGDDNNKSNSYQDHQRVAKENNHGNESPRFETSTENTNTNTNTNTTNSKLGFWRVVSDFATHPNFRYWIGMEMLMEGQNTFLGNFGKTFVDQLLRKENITEGDGWSNTACDWMLALLDPATQIVGLLLFLPIKRYGYALLYRVAFVTNILMALALLLSNGFDYQSHNTVPIAAFLFLSTVLSNAMAGAGFGLAMCDMVLEMKHSHKIAQGRKNPPSLAGLFMGVNALFCKPAESVLPILAAAFLGEGYNSENSEHDQVGSNKVVLYRLLVLPPLVCSVLQLALWSRYSLVPERTEQLRNELREYEEEQNKQQTDTPSVIEMNQLG